MPHDGMEKPRATDFTINAIRGSAVYKNNFYNF